MRGYRARTVVLAGGLALGVLWHTGVQGAIPGLGIMGDSLSDEYLEQAYGVYSMNWPMLLHIKRDIDLGPTAAMAGVPGGTWGSPRRLGFEHNWALSGATSNTLLSQGQHTGLAATIASKQLTHAVLAIGANDFAPGTSAYDGIYHGSWDAATIQDYVDSRVQNVTTAMDTALATGVNFALVNFPDYAVAPATKGSYPNAAQRELVTTVIAEINSQLESLAQSRQVVYVDLFDFSKTAFGTNLNPNASLTIGGNLVNLNSAGVGTGNAFVLDGIHPHTLLQGLLANLILEGFNSGYNAGIPLLSEEELVTFVGSSYGGDTLPPALADLSAFVRSYVPQVGDANGDGTVDGADYVIWASHFGQDRHTFVRGDFNGDGVVDGADYVLWASHFQGASTLSAPTMAVPEPASGWMATVGAGVVACWCARRRRSRGG